MDFFKFNSSDSVEMNQIKSLKRQLFVTNIFLKNYMNDTKKLKAEVQHLNEKMKFESSGFPVCKIGNYFENS